MNSWNLLSCLLSLSVTFKRISKVENMEIKIQLNPLSRRFRWASELKSNHGNYLCGTIQIPSALITEKHYRLELCLVPSSHVYSNDLFIHPNILHLTKPVTFETVGSITKDSWRQLFTLDFYNGTIASSKKVLFTITR